MVLPATLLISCSDSDSAASDFKSDKFASATLQSDSDVSGSSYDRFSSDTLQSDSVASDFKSNNFKSATVHSDSNASCPNSARFSSAALQSDYIVSDSSAYSSFDKFASDPFLSISDIILSDSNFSENRTFSVDIKKALYINENFHIFFAKVILIFLI